MGLGLWCKLLKKGLIGYVIKNNKKYFRAVDPHRILDFLKEKEEQLKKQGEEMLNLIPEIEKIQGINKKENCADYHWGWSGFNLCKLSRLPGFGANSKSRSD